MAKRPRCTAAVTAAALFVLVLSLAGPLPATAYGQGAPGSAPSRPTVAIVLGGGSSRGLAHIGLLQAFEEEGIPVDYLVGTSMGSIVAGLHAAGLSPENIEQLIVQSPVFELFAAARPSRGGLVETDRFERFLDAILDHATFDDVAIPYYSVATHLLTGEEAVIQHGRVSRAILASMAIPGVFPPVEIDGEYYVDGGVVSLIPVRAARRLGADVVIAVDVRRRFETVDPHNINSVLDITLHHLINAGVDEQLALADVVIHPQVSEDSHMDYDDAERFIAEGYRAAQEAMPRVKEVLLQHDPNFPFGSQPPPAGFPQDEFADRIAQAVSIAYGRGPWLPMSPRPSVAMSKGSPIIRAGFDVAVGRVSEESLLHASYGLERSARGWVNTIGLGTGRCDTVCGGVFARLARDDNTVHPGIVLQGYPGRRVHYRLEWEIRDAGSPQWKLALTAPAGVDALNRGYDVQFQMMQDSRGLYGPVHEDVKARALYRRYIPGGARNVAGIIRGLSTFYVGAGVGASFAEPTTLSPLAEAGVVLESRLFGVLPLRSRLAVVYGGKDERWSVRLTFGE